MATLSFFKFPFYSESTYNYQTTTVYNNIVFSFTMLHTPLSELDSKVDSVSSDLG